MPITLPGTGQIVQTVQIGSNHYQVLILSDSSGNVVGTTLLANGRGQNVVVLNEMAAKGVDLVNDDLTGALPLYLGAYACTSLSNAAYLVDNRLQALKVTGDGRLLTLPWTTPEEQLATTPVTFTTTGDVQLVPAQAADKKIALIGALIVNTSAVNTSLIIKNGTTVIGEIPVPAPGGAVPPTTWPLPLRGTVGTVMNGALRSAATSVIVTPIAYMTKG